MSVIEIKSDIFNYMNIDIIKLILSKFGMVVYVSLL